MVTLRFTRPYSVAEVRPAARSSYGGYGNRDRTIEVIDRRIEQLRSEQRTRRDQRSRSPSQGFTRRQVSRPVRSNHQGAKYQTLKVLVDNGRHLSENISVVREKSTRNIFFAKRVRAYDHYRRHALNELDALKAIPRGKNLSYLVEHLWSSGRTSVTLILEYCDAGTLHDMIGRKLLHGQSISEDFIWHVMHGVANALEFLHSRIRICHLDVKPSNVFLSNGNRTNAYPRIVLGDFGLVEFIEDIDNGQRRGRVSGTPGWHAPECNIGSWRYVTPAADIWQLAGTCQALARLLTLPNKGKMGTADVLGRSYSSSLNGAAKAMSEYNYRDRPSAQEVKAWAGRQVTGGR